MRYDHSSNNSDRLESNVRKKACTTIKITITKTKIDQTIKGKYEISARSSQIEMNVVEK